MSGGILCGDECESVVHVLWECPAYKDSREKFVVKLRVILEENSKDFEALNNIGKASFVLGYELWMEKLDFLLALVKQCIIDSWEARKDKLYGESRSTQLQSQSSARDPRDGTVDGGQKRGKLGKFSHSRRVTGQLFMNDNLCVRSCKTGSVHISGRMVNVGQPDDDDDDNEDDDGDDDDDNNDDDDDDDDDDDYDDDDDNDNDDDDDDDDNDDGDNKGTAATQTYMYQSVRYAHLVTRQSLPLVVSHPALFQVIKGED